MMCFSFKLLFLFCFLSLLFHPDPLGFVCVVSMLGSDLSHNVTGLVVGLWFVLFKLLFCMVFCALARSLL